MCSIDWNWESQTQYSRSVSNSSQVIFIQRRVVTKLRYDKEWIFVTSEIAEEIILPDSLNLKKYVLVHVCNR